MTNNRASGKSQWVHRQFNSEKIRYNERYRRSIRNKKSICSFSSLSPSSSQRSTLVLLPDAQFLRKYLALIEDIVLHYRAGDNDGDCKDCSQELKLVLLESVAEDMDYRNSSPCTVNILCEYARGEEVKEDEHVNNIQEEALVAKESPTVNERNRVVKLCLEHKLGDYVGVEVIPFPDLTLKNCNLVQDADDDFDLFSFIDMSIQDRSRCAIVRAAQFFYKAAQSQLKSESQSEPFSRGQQDQENQQKVQIIILTNNDRDTAIYTDEEYSSDQPHVKSTISLKAMNCYDFIMSLQNSLGNNTIDNTDDISTEEIEHWVKIKERCEKEYSSRNQVQQASQNGNSTLFDKDRYDHFEYLQVSELNQGLNEENKFLKGTLKVTNENSREAYCIVKGVGGKSVKYYLNENRGHFNRAIHGDTVIIEPLPKNQWEQPIGKRRLIHDGENDVRVENDFAHGNESIGMPTARVVGLSNSRSNPRRQYVATLVPKISGFHHDDSAIVVVPMDKKIPKIRIKTRIDHEKIANKRLLVEIDGWNLNTMYPSGHYVKTIGEVGDLDTEIKCLLIEHGIDLSPFSANALACLPQIRKEASWVIPSDEIGRRRDLRTSCRIFSVDPQGCQDIDDAMHTRVLESGDIEVGVHIADVTHFVKLRSALDKEAARRGTTFYLTDRRFDMLPSLLSSNLCSLHGNVDRLAVSVIWVLTPDLEEVKSTWYGRTVIHNVQAMTYEQAHNILHDKEPEGPGSLPPPPLTAGSPVNKSLIRYLKKDLSTLTRLARKLRSRRENIGGAVDLSSGERGSELKFVLDDDGKPVKVAPKKELEIHHTIAELMIMSNAFVAETIYKHFPDSSILRIHRSANIESFEELEKLLRASGMSFDGSTNKSLAQTLQDAKANQSSAQDSLFQSLATRAMSEAQYVCTGSMEEGVGLSHYGLGIGMYCHFTSPIRRYADIAVHHLLLGSLSKKDTHYFQSSSTEVHNTDQMIPDSNAISILSGDGLTNPPERATSDKKDVEDDIDEKFLDSLIEGTSELTRDTKMNEEEKEETEEKTDNDDIVLYKTTELTRICDNLNAQNRAAKRSSMECQSLFLSLYFRGNTEVTQAVIVDLKQNGLIVYVPKFDMKGPVYVADRNGCVQIIPKFLNLPSSSGLPPSSGFSGADGCRMFPDAKCNLHNADDMKNSRLEINIPDSTQKLTFKPLDVITVQVSCDLSKATARIPPPRLALVSKEKKQRKKNLNLALEKEHLNQATKSYGTKNLEVQPENNLPLQSLFEILSSIEITPNLDVPMRFQSHHKKIEIEGRVQTLKGRIHFGGYKDSSSLSIEDVSSELKILSLEESAKLGNYDASKRIERETTSRIQKKLAEKRNTRRAKRK